MVFVDDLNAPELDPDDHHHLARALRLPEGAPIVVADGHGGWRFARFGARPEPTGGITTEPEPPWKVTVGCAPVKGDRPEWTVQKLTELGVDRIVPIVAARSVVRWDEGRWTRQVARWRRIAREAAMQSRRPTLPEIGPLLGLDEFWDVCGADDGPERPAATPVRVALTDPDAPPLTDVVRAVAIGPEGGWTEAERLGRAAVSLPGGVLRAETAAIVAAALLAEHRRALPQILS
jgi:16S rRNA (uracil1498-N3)-methyltransferase